ncbi:MAG: cation diffusion facilitator family transporter [Gemmatimonadota bacterium]|nr:cation diffusion facilitator family transporter [Gemmatimonadota bacterium]
MTHTHSHLHSQGRAPSDYRRAFMIGVALNTAFVITEVVYGLSANSLALISDAGHNLSDVMGLLLAWGAIRLSRTRPTARRTYGLRRSSILAALANAAMLLFVTGAITVEAVRRLWSPAPVVASTIMWVAAVGVLINGVTAALFASGRKSDINIRGAFAHMASDALIALGVVITGFAIRATGWLWLDPVASIAIGLVIAVGTWSLLRESVNLAMDAVPENVDSAAVESLLGSIDGVSAVHDLHIWAMSTTETCLTAHLVAPAGLEDKTLAFARTELREHFGIGHSTIQVERNDEAPCEQADEGAV